MLERKPSQSTHHPNGDSHRRLWSVARAIKHYGTELIDPFPYRRYMRKHQCIFIHIPKAAGTSIRSNLGALSKTRDHFGYDVYQAYNPIRFECYFKFSFVRNPWDRLVSVYEYLRQGGNGKSDSALSEQVRMYGTFNQFANNVLTGQGTQLIKLLRPQVSYLCNPEGELMVDFVGRFESLEADFRHVTRVLKIKGSIEHLNKGTARDFREYYDDDTIELVQRTYSADVELFNYRFE